jgi:hypothetical protein
VVVHPGEGAGDHRGGVPVDQALIPGHGEHRGAAVGLRPGDLRGQRRRGDRQARVTVAEGVIGAGQPRTAGDRANVHPHPSARARRGGAPGEGPGHHRGGVPVDQALIPGHGEHRGAPVSLRTHHLGGQRRRGDGEAGVGVAEGVVGAGQPAAAGNGARVETHPGTWANGAGAPGQGAGDHRGGVPVDQPGVPGHGECRAATAVGLRPGNLRGQRRRADGDPGAGVANRVVRGGQPRTAGNRARVYPHPGTRADRRAAPGQSARHHRGGIPVDKALIPSHGERRGVAVGLRADDISGQRRRVHRLPPGQVHNLGLDAAPEVASRDRIDGSASRRQGGGGAGGGVDGPAELGQGQEAAPGDRGARPGGVGVERHTAAAVGRDRGGEGHRLPVHAGIGRGQQFALEQSHVLATGQAAGDSGVGAVPGVGRGNGMGAQRQRRGGAAGPVGGAGGLRQGLGGAAGDRGGRAVGVERNAATAVGGGEGGGEGHRLAEGAGLGRGHDRGRHGRVVRFGGPHIAGGLRRVIRAGIAALISRWAQRHRDRVDGRAALLQGQRIAAAPSQVRARILQVASPSESAVGAGLQVVTLIRRSARTVSLAPVSQDASLNLRQIAAAKVVGGVVGQRAEGDRCRGADGVDATPDIVVVDRAVHHGQCSAEIVDSSAPRYDIVEKVAARNGHRRL